MSFQIRVPFIWFEMSEYLLNLYCKTFRRKSPGTTLQLTNALSRSNMKISVPKTKSLTKQMVPFLINPLTVPGSFLLPFLPGYVHYLLLDLLGLLLFALSLVVLGPPQFEFSPLWPDAIHSLSAAASPCD